MKVLLLSTLVVAGVGCGNSPTIRCLNDSGCTHLSGAIGICVDKGDDGKGVCADVDSSCPSGFRYDDSAGAPAGTCYTFPDGSSPPDLAAETADMSDMNSSADFSMPDLVMPSGADLSTVAGKTFKLKTANTTRSLFSVFGVGADVFAVGAAGVAIHSNDGGNTWGVTTCSGPTELWDVWGASASDVYAVGSAGTVCRSTNQGANWAQISGSPLDPHTFFAIYGTAADNVVLAGDTGTVFRLTSVGGTWSKVTTGTAYTLWSVWGTGSTFFAGANGGAFFTGSNGGANWSAAQQTPATKPLYGVSGASATDVYLVGDTGTLEHTTNGGSSWSTPSFPSGLASVRWHRVITFGTDVYVVGSSATVLHSSDSGANFAQVTVPSGIGGAELNGVWGSSASDVYIVGAASATNENGGSIVLHLE